MEKSQTNYITIKCPHCGAEYVLDEIFIAKYITGKSNKPLKDTTGKILAIDFIEDPDLTELYHCDFCKKDFNVELDIKVKTSAVNEELDFSTDKVSLF